MLPQEPLSIGGVIDAGVSLFRSSFKATLPTALAVGIPYALVSALMSSQTVGLETQQDSALALEQAMQTFALMPFMYVTLCFAMAGIINRQLGIIRGHNETLASDIACAAKRCVPLSLIMLAFIVVIFVGFILLIIPGIILAASMSMFFYVSFMEDRSVWSSLGRSHSLVWGGNWWRTTIILSVIGVLGFVLSAVFYIGIAVVAVVDTQGVPGPAYLTLEAIFTWLMMALYLPLTSAMALVLYNDLLLRKDGGDLDARLDILEDTTAT